MADSKHNQGVTLVEMLVVLGIIVVLAGIAITATLRIDRQSKENALANAFSLVGSALREYYEVRDTFPPQPERLPANAVAHVELMLQALHTEPASRQVLDHLNSSYVKSEVGPPVGLDDVPELRDPWGTVLDYIYDHAAGDSFPELISAGPDRQFGTIDDISSRGRR